MRKNSIIVRNRPRTSLLLLSPRPAGILSLAGQISFCYLLVLPTLFHYMDGRRGNYREEPLCLFAFICGIRELLTMIDIISCIRATWFVLEGLALSGSVLKMRSVSERDI